MLVHCELESTSWLTVTNVMSVLLMCLENQDIISVCVLVFCFCQAYIHNIVEFQIATYKLLTGYLVSTVLFSQPGYWLP